MCSLGMESYPLPIVVPLFLHFLICVFFCPLILSSSKVVAPVFCSLPLAKARLLGLQDLLVSPGDFLEAHLISGPPQSSSAKDNLADKDVLLFLCEANLMAYLQVSFFV